MFTHQSLKNYLIIDFLFYFSYICSNKTRLMNGRILLNAEGSTDLEKYTFSNALALSVKLATWEASLEKYVDSIEFVVEVKKRFLSCPFINYLN